MENKINYHKRLEKTIASSCSDGRRPLILLHSCCGPCSSYVLEYLTQYFDILLYFFNPNIHPETEYIKRLETQKDVLKKMNLSASVRLIEGGYDPELFFKAVNGFENEPEGGKRCEICIKMRIKAAAKAAKEYNADFFATTLTVSPHKNEIYINETGNALQIEEGIPYLESDFKKKNGYKRSIELCREYNFYRQNYCGCVFSINT